MDEKERVDSSITIAWGLFIALWLSCALFLVTLTPQTVRQLQAGNHLASIALQDAIAGLYVFLARVDPWLILVIYAVSWLLLLAIATELLCLIWRGRP